MMSQTHIPREILVELCENASSVNDDPILYDDYSGRGMYGANCFGIEYSDNGSLMRIGAAIWEMFGPRGEHASIVEAGDLFDDARGTNVAMDYIVYFPSFITDHVDEDDDDEED